MADEDYVADDAVANNNEEEDTYTWNDLLLALSGHILLFLLVFGMSATVNIDHMKAQVRNFRAIITGVFLQFGVLPALGYAAVKTLQLDHAMGITLLVVTSSPGGSYSNWWCSMFNADLALSVTMTAISTILSIVALPMNLLFYTKLSYHEDVVSALDWTSLFISLAIVISAIGLGLLSSAMFNSKEFNVIANTLGNFAGIALVLFSAAIANAGDGSDSQIWEKDWDFYVGVASPCLVGLIVSNIITTILWLKRPERVTVSIECCYQNVGIATSVALAMFGGDELNEAMSVPFFYGVVEAVILGIYCLIAWKINWTKAPSSDPIWRVIAKSYEVEDPKDLQECYSVSLPHGDADHTKGEAVSSSYVEMKDIDNNNSSTKGGKKNSGSKNNNNKGTRKNKNKENLDKRLASC